MDKVAEVNDDVNKDLMDEFKEELQRRQGFDNQ